MTEANIFRCEPCNKIFTCLGNLNKHLKQGKAHCKCAPLPGHTTIDAFFKKVETDIISVATAIVDVKSQLSDVKSSIQELKISLEMKLTNAQLLADIEAMRVELIHAKELLALQVEIALLRAEKKPAAREERAKPETQKEPKEKSNRKPNRKLIQRRKNKN